MSRALGVIRRHPGWFAGLVVLILAAGGAVALGSAGGSVQAQAPNTVAAAAVGRPASGSPARTVSGSPARTASAVPVAATSTVRSQTPGSRGHHAGASATHGGAFATHDVRAAPPTSRDVALTLRQTTGLSPSQVAVRRLCPAAGPGHARCAAEALVLRSNGSLVHPRVAGASPNGPLSGNSPSFLQQAYDLSYLSQKGGNGDTVAIVDAFDDPTAESDLAAYRSFYNLGACTTANGCFRKINERGGSTPPSNSYGGWNQEISVDLDAVSAICPNCHILLVEANSASSSDMQTAMRTAAANGVQQISDSWTITQSYAPHGQYTFPGIATVAATGDAGYLGPGQDDFPAALPGVTAAGGTTLAPAAGAPNLRGFGESAWASGGSGCATEVAKPTYQSDTGCAGRSYVDVSADADPETGLAVYDNGSWLEVGGTSLATPLIAGYYAITGVTSSSPQWAYGNGGALNDVVTGSNGTNCTPSYICTAGVGYDGPTGVGSISGAAVVGAPGIGGTYTQSQAAHGATITGGVYPNGLYTTWSIQYGTSTQYGVQTSSTDIGAGSAPVAVTGYLSELAPNTTYHYRLVAQNGRGTAYGYDSTFTTPAASTGSPMAAFTLSPTPPAPNAPVTFDASGSSAGGGTLQTYAWNFGDGSPAQVTNGPTISYTYAQRGTYTVSLTVTNDAGQTDATTHTVTVDNAPSPAFTPSATVTAPDTVRLDASASAPGAGASITDYTWNFGDGTTEDTGTTATAAHTYANPGTYTVTLTTTDDLGVSGTSTQTVTVLGFTATPTAPAPGAPVTFTGPSSGGPFGTITDYSWSFGDGTTEDTGTSPTATDTFTARGTDTVNLTVTNAAGQTFTGAETVTVDTPPNGVLAASTIFAAPAQTVTLDGGNSTAAAGGSIELYTWNFGDGTAPVTAASPTATHAYAATGVYTATLTVTDNLGVAASAPATQTVTVDQPSAAFTAPSATLAPNAVGTFDASGSSDPEGTITGYSWSFGDPSPAQTASGPSITHSYSQRGQYTVALTVTNNHGQQATTTQTVTVDSAPTAAFAPSATLATPGTTVGFDAGASAAMPGGSIADYSWNFGDGSTEDGGPTATATHLYAAPGTYTATLTTTDDLGLSAAASEQVTIQAPPAAPAQTPTTAPPAQTSRTSTTAPGPAPAPTTTAPSPLTATLGAAAKQRLALALAHGVRASLSVSQATQASFQITLPVSESRLARDGRKPRARSIVLLRTGAQTLGAGAHAITLKLSRAQARELAGAAPLTLTVKVTLTEAGGATISRTVKVALTR